MREFSKQTCMHPSWLNFACVHQIYFWHIFSIGGFFHPTFTLSSLFWEINQSSKGLKYSLKASVLISRWSVITWKKEKIYHDLWFQYKIRKKSFLPPWHLSRVCWPPIWALSPVYFLLLCFHRNCNDAAVSRDPQDLKVRPCYYRTTLTKVF